MAKRIIDFLPALLSLVAFVFILLILFGGVGNQLADIFFLKINTSNLMLPSALSNANLLKGISELSGTDFIGSDLTASSLGLAGEYTVSLLTFCARNPSGPSCSSPSIKFWFDPGRELRLDNTPLRQQYPGGYRSALSSYEGVATRLLPGALVFGALSAGLTTMLAVMAAAAAAGGRAAKPLAGRAAALFAVLTAVVLLLADAAATHVFRILSAGITAGLGAHGLSASLGAGALALGWIALLLMLGVVGLMCVQLRALSSLGAGEKRPVQLHVASSEGRGFLSRIPGLGWHRYVQVERQQHQQQNRQQQNRQQQLMQGSKGIGGAVPRDAGADWIVGEEYSAERYSDRPANGIAMRTLSFSPSARTTANTSVMRARNGKGWLTVGT